MSATVTYKGSTLTTADNQTRVLETQGKYLEDNITITDVTSPTLQTKSATYTPTESQQTAQITADSGYDGLDEVDVTVNAIPSNYVGSGITRRSSSNLTVGGATVTAPSGYYPNSASASVESGREGTPIATKGTVSNHSVSVTPSVTNSAGYITGSTKTGTAVSVSASELVSGTLSVTSSGTKDVTNYASASIPSGTAGTPSASKGTVNNHSVTVTPSVTNTTGWITGSTINGTGVSVSASELVSGSETKTVNGTYDVTNLASVTVNVPSGYDIPIFSSNDGWTTVVCNKTYAQCIALLNEDGNGLAYANMGTSQAPDLVPLSGRINISDDDAIEYTFFDGTDSFDLIYRDNGTIVGNTPSLRMETLNVTENGTYVPPYPNFYGQVNVNVSGGGSSGTQVGTVTAMSYPSYVQFNGLLGAPTSFIMSSLEEIGVGERTIVATVCYDGTTFHGQGISSTSNANVQYLSSSVFIPQYNNGTLTISASGVEFLEEQNYKLVYTYGGSTSDISTADVQVGSGATSITFPVSGRPVYWSCIFKSNFSTSSGYQRVIAVSNDSSSTYGLAMDSVAHYATSWTSSYSGGNFTITSQGTNNGGYFHQPGYYQLTYYVDGSAPQYQSKTVTPTTSQQIVTPDSGYDALEQVTVNAIPSQYIIPSGNLPITANGNNINVSQYATVSVNVPSSGSSKNVQIAQGVNRVATTSYTEVSGQSLTVSKTGTYDVYWSGYRSSTSGTNGSQLYIGNSAYGSAQTTFSNHGQSIHLSNVSLTANQTISVRARARGTSYYMYVSNLTIIEQ